MSIRDFTDAANARKLSRFLAQVISTLSEERKHHVIYQYMQTNQGLAESHLEM